MSNNSIVSMHEMSFAIYEMEDGTMLPTFTPCDDVYSLRVEGVTEMPLAVRVVQVLRKRFQDGLLQQGFVQPLIRH